MSSFEPAEGVEQAVRLQRHVLHAADAGQRVELHLAPTPAQLALDPDAPERVVTFEVLEVTRHVPSRVRIVQGEEVSR